MKNPTIYQEVSIKTEKEVREMETQADQKKPKILCLHGFRTSAKILKKLIGRWPENLLEKVELVFLDGPYLARGKSSVEGFYDPPYYEWFQSNQVPTRTHYLSLFRSGINRQYTDLPFSDELAGSYIGEYYNFEECVEYLEEYMLKHGPFDGLLGFSQGALLSAALPGMQAQGAALTEVDKIKFVILISGGKFGGSKFSSPKLAENAFSSPIQCPSLHITGETDIAKPYAIELLASFVDPYVIFHQEGHIIPKLDEEGLKVMFQFIEKIQSLLHKRFEKIQSHM